jgi:glycosyltransferase involved in cell wall biosynthesis
MTPRMSVIIPAHDEAAILGGSLARLLEGDPDDELELIVVANGCSDATAEVARRASSRIRVIEIDAASKIAALNAGDEAATTYPRAYLDADVEIGATTLLALGDRLTTGPALVASPRLTVDTTGASLPVRQYYRVWEQSEYRSRGHIGSGVYVLSQEGRARFGRFPDVIADDRFVQQLFAPHERLVAEDLRFSVRAPRHFGALVRRAERIAQGNAQLARLHPEVAGASSATRFVPLLRRVLARPALWSAFPAYLVGYAVPKMNARRRARSGKLGGWNRDETTRVSA